MKNIIFFILLFWMADTNAQVIYFNKQYADPETTWGSGSSIIQIENGYILSGIGSGYNGWHNKNLIFASLDKEGNCYNWAHYGETYRHYYPGGSGAFLHEGNRYIMPVSTEIGDCLSSYLFAFDEDFIPAWYQGAFANYLNQDTCKTVFHSFDSVESGGFVMSGEQSPSASELSDIIIIKTDSLGNELWQNMIGGSWYEAATSIIQTPDSGFLLGGFKDNPSINYSRNALVVKTDKHGNEEWIKEFGGEFKDCPACVVNSYDGNYIIGFGYAFHENIPGLPYRKLSFMKINNLGDTIWHRKFGGIHLGNCVSEIIQTEDSNYIAVGSTATTPDTYIVGWLFKFTDSGDSLWYREYEANVGQFQQFLYDVELTDDNGYIMCGQSIWDDPPLPPIPQRMWVVKVDSLGCEWPYCDSTVGIKMTKEKSNLTVMVAPNPFNALTTISYTLDKFSTVSISIFNFQAQLIERMELKQPKGEQHVKWDAGGLARGMYYYKIQAGDKIGGGKMILIR